MDEKKSTAWSAVMIAALLVIVDQITKIFAAFFLPGTGGLPVIPGVFQFYYLENAGAAFGILKNSRLFFIFIALVIIVFTVFVTFRMPAQTHYHPLRFACILIMAGAAGNMIDRIFRGYVVDFLYFSLIDFPVFNLADCFVCIGVVLAAVLMITLYRKDDLTKDLGL